MNLQAVQSGRKNLGYCCASARACQLKINMRYILQAGAVTKRHVNMPFCQNMPFARTCLFASTKAFHVEKRVMYVLLTHLLELPKVEMFLEQCFVMLLDVKGL